MDDTSALMGQKMKEMMQKKSAAQRLIMGCAMFDFSKQLVMEGLKREVPDLSRAMLRKGLFLKFYGEDFNSKNQKKILRHLANH